MNKLNGTKRMSSNHAKLREALIKQNMRDNFVITDEEWEKINDEKVANRRSYVAAGTSQTKKKGAVAIVHKKNGTVINIKI